MKPGLEQIEALVADVAKRHGKSGMQAVATLMYGLGSEATIHFPDDSWVPCDFLMQMAWANGGQPDPK